MRITKPILAGRTASIITAKAGIKRKIIQRRINFNNMHRRNKLITVFAAAAISFGTLWVTLGEEGFNRGYRHHHANWEHHHHHCDYHEDAESESGD